MLNMIDCLKGQRVSSDPTGGNARAAVNVKSFLMAVFRENTASVVIDYLHIKVAAGQFRNVYANPMYV